jgi:hypothetical protein
MGVAPVPFQMGKAKREVKMKSPNYVAVLAILNAMLRRVSESLPQIQQASRELGYSEIPTKARAGK